MADVFRTLVVEAADADLARTIAATLDPAHSQGMWETPLSPTGAEPATHYISTGYIGEGFAALVPLATWAQEGEPPEWVQTEYEPGDSFTVLALCEKAGLEITLEQIEDLFATSDVTTEDPWVSLGRLGLKIVTPEVPAEEPVDG
jgi:hypothetical protein